MSREAVEKLIYAFTGMTLSEYAKAVKKELDEKELGGKNT